MTSAEEQQKIVQEEKANAKTNKIISWLFIGAFCAAPAGVLAYNAVSALKANHKTKVKEQQKEETRAKKALSLIFVNTRQR